LYINELDQYKIFILQNAPMIGFAAGYDGFDCDYEYECERENFCVGGGDGDDDDGGGDGHRADVAASHHGVAVGWPLASLLVTRLDPSPDQSRTVVASAAAATAVVVAGVAREANVAVVVAAEHEDPAAEGAIADDGRDQWNDGQSFPRNKTQCQTIDPAPCPSVDAWLFGTVSGTVQAKQSSAPWTRLHP